MELRLADLAERLGGRLEGDPDRTIRRVRTLERAEAGDLSFATGPRYATAAAASRATALLVPESLAEELRSPRRGLVVVDDVMAALAEVLELLHPPVEPAPGVHPSAVVDIGAEVDPSASVGAFAVVGERSRVGPRARLGAHVVLGRGCRVGAEAVLHPGVVLYDGSEVGERSVVHAGTVLGADGFGYTQTGAEHRKVPQVGRAVVEADVEIGANAAVDRALLEETRIGAGTKIDNLVQVGHNVVVGRACLLVAQAGIAGSTRLGDGVVLAGQSGVAGHLEVGDGVRVAAKSAVFKDVPAGRQVAGIPAVDAGAWRRQRALLGRLDDLRRRLRRLERGAGEGEPGPSGAADEEEA